MQKCNVLQYSILLPVLEETESVATTVQQLTESSVMPSYCKTKWTWRYELSAIILHDCRMPVSPKGTVCPMFSVSDIFHTTQLQYKRFTVISTLRTRYTNKI